MERPVVDCPRSDDVAAVLGVRDVLVKHGYTVEGLVEAIHLEGASVVEPKGKAVILHRTAAGTPLDTLIRLFILGVPADFEAVARAVAPMGVEEWAELGLVVVNGDSATATVQIRCFDDLLVAFDFGTKPGVEGGLRGDYVMGISLSTLTLAGLTVRPHSRATLDVGTGSGFHAFVAASHSDQVVATDRSARAIEMAKFNTVLNGIENVTCVAGDLFEPVKGQRFDLIVSNPPFIISPDSTHLFLHSGLQGDDVCHRIVQEAPAHLEEGGYCQLMANWVIPPGGDWAGRLKTWFEGSGCDGFILERGRQDPEEYAAVWIETSEVDPALIQPTFDRWLTYFRDQGIEAIGTGLITLRRRTAERNWFRVAAAPDKIGYPAGDEIERIFARRDFLESVGDDELLDVALRLAGGVQLVQEATHAGDTWVTTAAHLRRTEGFEYAGGVDAEGARLLARCDGRSTLRELIADLVHGTDIDEAQLEQGVASIMRELMERGFVLPPVTA